MKGALFSTLLLPLSATGSFSQELLSAPPPTHLLYIPAVVLLGIVIGYVIGRRAGIKTGEAEFLAGDDDDLL